MWLNLHYTVLAGMTISIVGLVGFFLVGVVFACCVVRKKYRKNTEKGVVIWKEDKPEAISVKVDVELTVVEVEDDNEQQDLQLPRRVSCVTCGVGTLRQVALALLQDILVNLIHVRLKLYERQRKVKRPSVNQYGFSDSYADELKSWMQTFPINCSFLCAEMDAVTVRQLVEEYVKHVFPEDLKTKETFVSNLEAILTAPTAQLLLDAMYRTLRVQLAVLGQWGLDGNEDFVGTVPEDNEGAVMIQVNYLLSSLKILWNEDEYKPEFLETVSRQMQMLRDERRRPSNTEYISFFLAHCYLTRGFRLASVPYCPLRSSGFRPHAQTFLTLADPGPGHVKGTARYNEWMKGVIVEVENAEEGKQMTDVSDLRECSLFNLAKVRLHVGSQTPVCYCLGRAMRLWKTETFEDRFLEDVQVRSCAATIAFQHGAAECKIDLRFLTSQQAVQYMNALRYKINREKAMQFLSAILNMKQLLSDDVTGKTLRETGVEAVQTITRGGFDKLVIDITGAFSLFKGTTEDTFLPDLIYIVHVAHSQGLQIELTPANTTDDIRFAVLAGADAVNMSPDLLRSKVMGKSGPYMEENISSLIQFRDHVAGTSLGKAVHLMARMDTMFCDGSLERDMTKTRITLLTAVNSRDEQQLAWVEQAVDSLVKLPVDSCHALCGTARRLCEARYALLQEVVDSPKDMEDLLSRLQRHLQTRDHDALEEEYNSVPWTDYRKKYRKLTPGQNLQDWSKLN